MTGPLTPYGEPVEENRVVRWTCACGREVEVPRELAGETVDCPYCGPGMLSEEAHDPDSDVKPEARSRPRKGSWLRLLLILLAVGGIVSGVILWPVLFPSPGVQLTYRLLFPEDYEGDPQKDGEKALKALVRRSNEWGAPAKGRVEAPDRIILRASLDRKSDLESLTKALGRFTQFGLYAVAPQDVQARFNQSQTVPSGYRVMRNQPSGERFLDGPYSTWDKDVILLEEPAAVTSRHVLKTKVDSYVVPSGLNWVVHFQLNFEGAKRFDGSARELFHRDPPGMIAIVVDGKIRSMPVIRAEKFGGRGQVDGLEGEEEATELSAVLQAGDLPIPVGRKEGERGIPGDPERVEWYGFDE